MKLKRLIIHGFKSFKDRTTIHFDDGITGIVGPNGCGKSNIVDALFWVMGEQSAKHLRGASMKDLIFAGSSKYTPGAWAEVSLVLDNDEGKHIHIGNQVANPSEIQLTRKLYRNGETEYRINNIPCRLKDIQEVFMDTGAGAKSYSIIAQGEINRLVQSKPEERRVMIEEVAGITKFKIRKRESLRKIEQTQENLTRLIDLKLEIERNLKQLEGQSEKAKRARELKEKVEHNELNVSSHQEYELLKNIREGKQLLTQWKEDIESWSVKKNILELGLEDERLKKYELTDQLEELQREFNEISKSLAAAEERLNYLKKSKDEKESLVTSRQEESEALQEDLQGRLELLEQLREQKEQLARAREEMEDFSELERTVAALQGDLSRIEGLANSYKKELDGKKEQLVLLEQDAFKKTSKLEEFATILSDTGQELEELKSQTCEIQGLFEQQEVQLAQLEEDFSTKGTTQEILKEEINRDSLNNQQLEKTCQEKLKELLQVESDYNSLKALCDSMEGVNEGNLAFLKQAPAGYYLLGNSIRCEEQYSLAVQSLLQEISEAIVAAESDYICHWMSENREMGVEFLREASALVDYQATRRWLDANIGNTVSLVDIVQMQGNEKGLLEGYFICAQLTSEHWQHVPSDLAFNAIVSGDGKTLIKRTGNGLVLKQGDNSSGLVARNSRLEVLGRQLVILKDGMTQLEQQVEKSRTELTGKIERNERLREDLSQLTVTISVKKSEQESKKQHLKLLTGKIEILEDKKAEITQRQLDLLSGEEQLKTSLQSLRDGVSECLADYQNASSELEQRRIEYTREKEDLLKKQVEARTLQERISSANMQWDDVTRQVERLEERIVGNQEFIERYKTDIVQMGEELTELSQQNRQIAQDLMGKEKVLLERKGALNELIASMQGREDEVKKLEREIGQTDRKVVEYEIKVEQYLAEEEQLVKNIFERYHVDLRQILGNFLEYQREDIERLHDLTTTFFVETEFGTKEVEKVSYLFNKQSPGELKECQSKLKKYKAEYYQLGEINWQAIEDYERQKRRFDFLRTQEEELQKSLQDLQEAIEHIDAKSKERFKVAFEEVNERFQKVFPIIFGGGTASLKVTGELDDIECGVDIDAKPPGKKMQNINLMSGGEKAMTAVSLIFSIFLVKPSPFCLLDEVDAPLDDANVGRFNELLREMSNDSQFILITHNKKTMEMNDVLYGVTMQEPGISKAVSVQLH